MRFGPCMTRKQRFMIGDHRNREPGRMALLLFGALAGLALPLGSYLSIAVGIEWIINNVIVAEMATVFCLVPGLFLGPVAGIFALPIVYRRSKSRATLAQIALRVGAFGFAIGVVLPFLLFSVLLLLSL